MLYRKFEKYIRTHADSVKMPACVHSFIRFICLYMLASELVAQAGEGNTLLTESEFEESSDVGISGFETEG